MLNRRTFFRITAGGLAVTQLVGLSLFAAETKGKSIRLGGQLFETYRSPEEWIRILKSKKYRAAYCPVIPGSPKALIREYAEAAKENDVLIAEVGAWSNPVSTDPSEAKAALEKCIEALSLAEQIGANCCVNVSGSRNAKYWAGPDKDNFSQEVFNLVVETTQKIIDEVNPKHTTFVLEPMPWSIPDSADSYLQLLEAVNRKAFAVHLDPVNLIRSPREFYGNGDLIRELFQKLGPHIRSCHAKDIILREDNYIPQMDEVRPGMGNLDYPVLLTELAQLNDIPLMMEHLRTDEEYGLAADFIRRTGNALGITI